MRAHKKGTPDVDGGVVGGLLRHFQLRNAQTSQKVKNVVQTVRGGIICKLLRRLQFRNVLRFGRKFNNAWMSSKVGMFALSHAGCCRRDKQIACGTLFAANMYWKCYSRREGTRNAIDDQNVLETLLRRTTWQPSIGFPVILVGSWGGRYDRPQIVVCNTDT